MELSVAGVIYFFFSAFSKHPFSPQLEHFCGLQRPSFSNPHLLHLKVAICVILHR
jgi:hypothetical protein